MIVDRALVDRLETSAAVAAAALAHALSTRVPETGAVAEPLGDGALVALGPGRYVNRAVGASLAPVDPDRLVDALVAFFAARGLAPSIEVCTWAPAGLLDELGRRGFRPSWFRNVYARPAGAGIDVGEDEPAGAPPASLVVREVDESLVAAWSGVLADGNGIVDPALRAISDEFAAAAHAGPDRTDYLAEVDGQPAGCGSLERVRGVGWVGAAATVPAFGGRGVQGALLRRRIGDAAHAGCDLVAASALPGGRSARNLERHGFSQAYAQLVMTLA